MSDLVGVSPRHDPGGLTQFLMLPALAGSAIYGGANGAYRYTLSRTWKLDAATVLVVMMNPCIGEERVNDPTLAKVTNMAAHWREGSFGSLLIGNVFAYRTTNQSDLGAAADPVGPENDVHLVAMAAMARLVVFAYGESKVARLRSRGPALARMLLANGAQPHVLRLSRDGTPRHPLSMPTDTVPVLWHPPP